MTKELQAIAAIPGIAGVCLHRGRDIMEHAFPDNYSDSAEDLCSAVVGAFSAYARAERPLTQSYFQYPESGILVLTATPKSRPRPAPAADFFLTFLVRDPAALAAVMAPAREFLEKEAASA
jgi:hypothetical protein